MILNFYLKKKAVSPLIATILLVVVSVVLVTIILNWGTLFTTSSLDSASGVISLTKSDAEFFIYPKSLKDGLLQFNYSPQSDFGDINIVSYKVLSDSGETPQQSFSSGYLLKQGTNVISLPNFSSLSLATNIEVTIVLQTIDNQYISIKNIKNDFIEVPVDLPYIMFGNSKLYIQPFEAESTMNWTSAIDYCDDLDANGYDDWYLPSMSQFPEVWLACTAQTKSNTCMNDAIKSTYSTPDDFVTLTMNPYWTSTEYGADDAYSVNSYYGDISRYDKTDVRSVRCVRDQ